MKYLGKIVSVKFGNGGYQDAMFGLTVGIDFPMNGGMSSLLASVVARIPREEDRPAFHHVFADRMLDVAKIMEAAKVDDIGLLKGKPVEVEFDDDGNLRGWRILTEVL